MCIRDRRYSLRGEHPANDKVNEYIHKAENAAERARQEWQENRDEASKEDKQ